MSHFYWAPRPTDLKLCTVMYLGILDDTRTRIKNLSKKWNFYVIQPCTLKFSIHIVCLLFITYLKKKFSNICNNVYKILIFPTQASSNLPCALFLEFSGTLYPHISFFAYLLPRSINLSNASIKTNIATSVWRGNAKNRHTRLKILLA